MRYAVAFAIIAFLWLMGMTAVAFFILVVLLPILFLTRSWSRGEWKLRLRYGAALLGAILGYLAVKESNLGFLVTLAVMVPVFLLVERVWWHEQTVDQRVRNVEFGQKASAGNISDRTVLFLRPFQLDNMRGFRNPRRDSTAATFIPLYSLTIADSVTLDEAIRHHLQPDYELVAIGQQKDALGATRLETTEENWRAWFRDLAERARAIVVFPSRKAGTRWEMGEICANPATLQKTLFLMPPNGYHNVDPESTLENVRALLLAHGCELPADVGPGEGVVFDASNRVKGRGTIIESLLFFAVSKVELYRCMALIGDSTHLQQQEIE